VRVCILQPLVPRYRLPVFSALARATGIDLEVWADARGSQGSLAGATGSSEFRLVHAFHRRIAGVYLQPACIRAAVSRFDVLVMSDNVRQPGLWAALAVPRRPPIVLWGHGYGTTNPRIGDLLRRATIWSADAALFYSSRGRDRFVAMGVDPGKLFIAPNAIDQVPIANAIKRCDELARSRVLSEQGLLGRRLMLFMSRLEPEKRPDLAIEALARLRAAHPQLALVFIGDGSQRTSLAQLAQARGVYDHVRFLGTLHDENRIAPWAISSQLLVHPGALGLTVLHAFGYGLPVVTTADKRIQMPESDCLRHGLNGLEYEPGQLQSLVECCSNILADDALRAQMSAAALATVHGDHGHNVGSMVEGMLQAINYAASSSLPARRNR
jgi:glycosyltransferase involved in cell wall biosynthesis